MNKYLTYNDAKQVVKALNLKSHKDWENYVKCRAPNPLFVNQLGVSLPQRPNNIPYEPHRFYTKTNEWISFPDFLGYKAKSEIKYWSYEKSKEYAQKWNIKSEVQWYNHHKKHKLKSIPKKVSNHFKITNEWISWSDFLNHNILHSTEKTKLYLPATQARKYIHALNLPNKQQYNNWWNENKPYFLPRGIDVIYGRTGQFSSFDDFLGISTYSRMQTLVIDISVLYVARIPNTPNNVFEIAVEPKGEIEVINNKRYILTKLYEYDVNNSIQVKHIINTHCTNWWDGDANQYVVQNIHQLLYELNMILNMILNRIAT